MRRVAALGLKVKCEVFIHFFTLLKCYSAWSMIGYVMCARVKWYKNQIFGVLSSFARRCQVTFLVGKLTFGLQV